ncbi:MAG: TonB-dependent receptor [Olivibacter sp.]|nr:TonB-dependent receptor [Olivibacter sp. UJ_SKK_5.1]
MHIRFWQVFSFLTLVLNVKVLIAQTHYRANGTIYDVNTKLPIPNVTIKAKNSKITTTTDVNGSFVIEITDNDILKVSHVGYHTIERSVTSAENITFYLSPANILGDEVVVSASRIPESFMRSPVSVEILNSETLNIQPSPSFYDAITSLKGVESSVQSLTFRSLTTRGFGSNGNVRFNQFVDGMDNQGPGLNFPVGNVVGLSDLDVAKVELLHGTASALYGAGGTNGTLLISSKDPFEYQGLSLSLRSGINHVNSKNKGTGFVPDLSLRFAKAINESWAFKVSLSYLQADDWIANDYRNIDRLNFTNKHGLSHVDDPNYDGINVYGDEINTNIKEVASQMAKAGLIPNSAVDLVPDQLVSRTGYTERDLVDYGTKNFKANAALHYRFTDNITGILQGNWGTGTAIYTGSDRFVLKNFQMGQYKAEIKGSQFYVRAYTSQERSGDTYNASALGTILNETWKNSELWFPQYTGAFITAVTNGANETEAHNLARIEADKGRFDPNTTEFQQAKQAIVGNYIGFGENRNGAKFYERTNLYHYEGMYDLSKEIKYVDLQFGASYRKYALNSDGTLFDDSDHKININEYGGFIQVSKYAFDNKIKFTGAVRYDKNENFEGRFTPRFSGVYTIAEKHNFRLSYQEGFRNPTTQDQYIDLPVRSNTQVIGGLPSVLSKYDLYNNKGFTQESVQWFLSTGDPTKLHQYSLGQLKPEKVRSYEVGYKAIIADKLLIDAYYYYATYNDFISTLVLLQSPDGTPAGLTSPNIFSTVVNNPEKVSTNGWAIGLDYILGNWLISSNTSYNSIDNKGKGLNNDFNTPKYRVNFGVSNKQLVGNLGVSANWRWQQKFFWNSTFAFGDIPAFGTIDAQVSYSLPTYNAIVKLGGSNILNKYYRTSTGNPSIGALYYLGVTFNSLFN